MIVLSALLPAEISQALGLTQSFRGKQIFRQLHGLNFDLQAMTDLPRDLRARLATAATAISSQIAERHPGEDGSLKLKLLLSDGLAIESVLLKDSAQRQTLCLSTQAGCAMGCLFCRTASMGLMRNLTDFEIVEQYLWARKEYGEIHNLVFMGMGEPLQNLAALGRAVAIFNNPAAHNISLRRMTVSTCGLVQGIRRLTEQGPLVRLAFSLITADEQQRRRLMPSAAANSLADLKAALLVFQQKTAKRITLEVVLIKDITDRDADLKALLDFIPPLKVIVNVIPLNTAGNPRWVETRPQRVEEIVRYLTGRAIKVSRRFSRGRGINAACGQLCVEAGGKANEG